MDELGQIQDRNLPRTAYIEDLSAHVLLLYSRHETTDGVRNVCETPGLQTVTMDGNRFALQNGIDEHRLRAAPPTQGMTRTVRSENPDDGDGNFPRIRVG